MYASVEDVEQRLGETPCDREQTESLIRYASALIEGYTGRSWVPDDVPEPVRVVCVEVVLRTLMNPAGVSQDTAGPFNSSYGSEAPQRMFLTKSDRTVLARFARNQLKTISTTRGPIETGSVRIRPGWRELL